MGLSSINEDTLKVKRFYLFVLIFQIFIFFPLIPGHLSAQEKDIAGRVFQKDIGMAEFRAELQLLRSQLSPNFSNRGLWQRFAFLGKAKRLNIQPGKDALMQALARMARGHLIKIDAKKGIQGPLSNPDNKVIYEKKIKELASNFVFNKTVLQRFLKIRKISQPDLERIVIENLTIEKLLKQQSQGWSVKATAQKKKVELLGRCKIELIELHSDDHLLNLQSPEELQLRLFYSKNRKSYRRSRQLKLRFIQRSDDGSLTVLAKIRGHWMAGKTARSAQDLSQLLTYERIEAVGETALRPWSQLVLPAMMKDPQVQDIVQRLKIGEISMPLRFGGVQLLIQCVDHQIPRQLSFEELQRLAPNPLLRDWRRYHSLNNLLMKAHKIRRQLDKANWSPEALQEFSGALRSVPEFQLKSSTRYSQYPQYLYREALRLNPKQSFIHSDIAGRRLFIGRVLKRHRPSFQDFAPDKRELAEAQRILGLQWRTSVFLESKGVDGAIQDYARSLLAPIHKAVVRQLAVPRDYPVKDLEALKEQFTNGSGLNLLALRMKQDIAKSLNVYQSSDLARAAEFAAPYKIVGPFPAQHSVHLIITQALLKGPSQTAQRSRVFHMAFKINKNFKLASDRAELMKARLKQIQNNSLRLKAFRRLAREVSEAPTAAIGGYVGQVQIEDSPVIRGCKQQLALLEAGERCQFPVDGQHVFLTVLDISPLRQNEDRKFDRLFDQALPWSDQIDK
jgi:hypothetical protein